ncbi:hypothetical protein [Streptomyces sp. NPDC060031]
MITLHDLHKRGGDIETAVLAFGDLHRPGTVTGQAPGPTGSAPKSTGDNS